MFYCKIPRNRYFLGLTESCGKMYNINNYPLRIGYSLLYLLLYLHSFLHCNLKISEA